MLQPTTQDISAKRKVLREDVVEAVQIAQGVHGWDEMQGFINRGLWGLEGSFGRAMMDAIEQGACMLGEKATRDYWGNPIPGRYDVQPGTKGSPEYALAYWNEQ